MDSNELESELRAEVARIRAEHLAEAELAALEAQLHAELTELERLKKESL
jgi:hypothetical protein